jgi:hypothetical protein
MGAFGDAAAALKNVVLMQERLERTQADIATLSADLLKLKGFTHDLDKRLYAVERIMDLGARQSQQKRIEE